MRAGSCDSDNPGTFHPLVRVSCCALTVVVGGLGMGMRGFSPKCLRPRAGSPLLPLALSPGFGVKALVSRPPGWEGRWRPLRQRSQQNWVDTVIMWVAGAGGTPGGRAFPLGLLGNERR